MDQAYRLTFQYREGHLVERGVQRLEMRIPAVDTKPDGLGRFIELRSESGSALYRRNVTHEIPLEIEFPSDDPQHPLGRVNPPENAIFAVLVPFDSHAVIATLVEVREPRTSELGDIQRGFVEEEIVQVTLVEGDKVIS